MLSVRLPRLSALYPISRRYMSSSRSKVQKKKLSKVIAPCISVSTRDITRKTYPLSAYIASMSSYLATNILVTSSSCYEVILTTPYICSSLGNADAFPVFASLYTASFLGGLLSCYKVRTYKPRLKKKDGKNIVIDDIGRKAWVTILFATQGVAISPIVYTCMDTMPSALIVTGTLVAATLTASMYLPKVVMLPYGPALSTGLRGLIGMGIIGIWFPVLHTIETYVGIALFTAYNAYDTQLLIESYEKRAIDPMSHSISYAVNGINISSWVTILLHFH